MSEHLSIAIVGAGYWGPNLVRNFQRIEGVHVSWVCDARQGRRDYIRERFPGLRVTPRFSDILRDPNVAAVVIATPVSTHYELAVESLKAGKHVMVEKPLADTVDHALRMVDMAADRHLILAVDHLFVHNPAIGTAKTLIAKGEIGSICYSESSRVNLGPPSSEVDVIWDLATHDLSISYFLWGKLPDEVVAYGRKYIHPSLVDVAFVHLHFDDGSMAVHHVSWLSPDKVRRYFVSGTQGSLLFDDTVPSNKLKQIDQGVDSRIGLRDDEAKELFYRPGEIRFPEHDETEPLLASCVDFVDSILDGKSPKTDGVAGLAVVRMLEAAERSMVMGSKPVRLTTV